MTTQSPPNVPPARRGDDADELFGHRIPDPYRWLENPDSEETQAWLAAQDRLFSAAAAAWSWRDHFQRRVGELAAAGLVTPPVHRGERLFFLRREPGQQHPVLYVREGDGAERAIIDPHALSDDDTITLDAWWPSWEGDRLAYQLSEAGDEEAALWVMDVDGGEVIDGPIDRVRYCPFAWLPGGDAYYYGRRLPPEALPPDEVQYHRRLYGRVLGSDPATDQMVFGEGRDKTEYHTVDVSRDGRWLLVAAAQGTAPRNDLWIAGLAGSGRLTTVVEGADAITSAWVEDGLFYAHTNLDAPHFRLVVADPERPQPEHWRDLLSESQAVLTGCALTRGAVVAAWRRNAVSKVTVHSRVDGALTSELRLPGMGAVEALSGRHDGDDAWIGYTDFTTPPRVLHCDTGRGTTGVWAAAPVDARPGPVDARQVTYRSADGTEVRMFVLQAADQPPPRPAPTILYGYGGFNIALTPAWSPAILAWVEAGGVYAVANLRGGSEEGEEWHRAGMREHKQNVFDDFTAAAKHLVAQGVCSPATLGIYGGSNGGLLVGAALTQRPDLFAAAVCAAPLLDMVRYERFGMGATWNDEYGTAADPEELGWLLSYSPYHHVEEGADYPAVLFSVFDSDTRVDPMHARKMCAALQSASSSTRPILLRREEKVGHGARSVSRDAAHRADVLAFFAHELSLGLPPLA